jgi:hypothetical protein
MSPTSGNGENLTIDIASALGADGGLLADCITFYIPNKDRNDQEIGNQRKWVLEALQLLGNIGTGATAMPAAEGVWRKSQGILVWEHPVIVYSYVHASEFAAALPTIREFLHRMGRETNQGEVAFEFADQFFRIRTFDSP